MGWIPPLALLAFSATSSLCAAQSLPPAPAGVEVTTSYGVQYSTIGPAVRQTTAEELSNWEAHGGQLGGITTPYRMARTEVTVGEWFQFIQAYAPYNQGVPNDPSLTGIYIYTLSNDEHGRPIYQMGTGVQNYPATMGWRFAAIYCNWLHNDRALTESAFTTGAYDTSTFTENPDGSFNDALTHLPGARYWIPSQDEWTQAAFYDQNRYGPGMPGYWSQPNGSDIPSIPGLAGTPGGTSAGEHAYFNGNINVGSYDTMSPSGLLDLSGGQREWLENPYFNRALREIRGTGSGIGGVETVLYNDSINWWGLSDVLAGLPGLRLASSVPTPSSAFLLLGLVAGVGGRRRIRP